MSLYFLMRILWIYDQRMVYLFVLKLKTNGARRYQLKSKCSTNSIGLKRFRQSIVLNTSRSFDKQKKYAVKKLIYHPHNLHNDNLVYFEFP